MVQKKQNEAERTAMRQLDYGGVPKGLLTPETVSLVSAVHERRCHQGLYLFAKPDVLDALPEIAKAQSTGASNRIERIRRPSRGH